VSHPAPGNLFKNARRYPAWLGSAVLLFSTGSPALGRDPGQQEVTRDFAKTVTLSGNQGLSLDHRLGEVHIHGDSGHELKISAKIHVQDRTSDDAQNFAQKIQIEVRESSDGVHVRTIYPDTKSHLPVIRIGGRTSYSVDYEITMPADAPLWLHNEFGNAEVSGVHGWSQIENGHGVLTDRDAGSAKLVNSFGRIELSNASGNCSVTDNNGAVKVSNVQGTLEVRNRFGEIEASQISGAATISGGNGAVSLAGAGGNSTINNSFGEVTAHNINGNLSVSSSNGKIDVSDVSANADLKTSFGAVEAVRIGGTLTVHNNNGSVDISEARGLVSATTSFGTITVSHLHSGANLVTGNGAIELSDIQGDVYTKTSFGSVHVENVKGKFTAQDSNGAVTAKSVQDDATVDTSFSGVSLENIGGKIRVNNQNGAIDVTAASSSGCRDINLKTSFSHITVRIPANDGYKVNAHTSFGHITTELPVTATGSMEGNSLNGTIGNGACSLDLTNSNGNIEISRAP
jgi:hypothetical protein